MAGKQYKMFNLLFKRYHKKRRGKCWICGEKADSAEHKFKKSLLKEVFHKEFANKEMVHVKYGDIHKLPGPNSNRIKYEEVICSKCNNSKTQPHDIAFDVFSKFIRKNYVKIDKTRMIDFKEIYGDDFPAQQLNLFKYFVKIFGCDISKHDMIVPPDIVSLMSKKHFQTKLKITLSINEDIMDSDNPTNSLYGIGHLITTSSNLKSKSEIQTKYRFEMNLFYLRINFFYNTFTDIGVGSDWIANKQYLYLGQSREMNLNFI